MIYCQLHQKIIKPTKMFTSVNLMCALPWKKLAINYVKFVTISIGKVLSLFMLSCIFGTNIQKNAVSFLSNFGFFLTFRKNPNSDFF